MALPLFLTYSALNGFTLSFIIARYAQATVYKAFVVSALMFFIMSAIGRVTKKDLSGMGRAFMGALIGIIIASIANIFLQSSGMDYVLSILCVIIFAGLTAWDNQKIRYVYEQSNSQPTNGWVVALAFRTSILISSTCSSISCVFLDATINRKSRETGFFCWKTCDILKKIDRMRIFNETSIY